MLRRGLLQTVEGLVSHPIARRFLKFAIVGASSTLIDNGVFNLFVLGLDWQSKAIPFSVAGSSFSLPMTVPANCISFTIGVTNGFLWNRLWTFGSPEGHVPTQYVRFVLVNLVGLVVDTLVVVAAWPLLRGLLSERIVPTAAKIAAIPPVALWNFTAHSLWTFAPARNDELTR